MSGVEVDDTPAHQTPVQHPLQDGSSTSMDPKVQEAIGLLQRRTQEKEAEQDAINKSLEERLLQTLERNRKLESRLRKLNQASGGRRLAFSSDEESGEKDESDGGRSRRTGEPRRKDTKKNRSEGVGADRINTERGQATGDLRKTISERVASGKGKGKAPAQESSDSEGSSDLKIMLGPKELRAIIQEEIGGISRKKRGSDTKIGLTMPLSEQIRLSKPPKSFRPPKFDSYSGKGDPYEHILHFEGRLQAWGCEETLQDALLCKMFVSTFSGSTLVWFQRMKPNSVTSFEDLKSKFTSNYATNVKVDKEVDHLFTIVQRDGESLRSFMTRFTNEKAQIHDCPDSLSVIAFKQGLRANQDFYRWIKLKQGLSMTEVQDKAALYMALEEEKRGEKRGRTEKRVGAIESRAIPRKSGRTTRRTGGPVAYERRTAREFEYEGVDPWEEYRIPVNHDEMVKRLKDIPETKWPNPLRGNDRDRDQTKYCSFHKEHGHPTSDCYQLKRQVTWLIDNGYKEELLAGKEKEVMAVKRVRRPTGRRSDEERDQEEASKAAYHVGLIGTTQKPGLEDARPSKLYTADQMRQFVATIHGGYASGGRTAADRRRHTEAAENLEVGLMRVQEDDGVDIVFTKHDLEGIHFPHDDALVIGLTIGRSYVERIMVDTGSSVDIIYLDTLRKMNFDEKFIEKDDLNLVGFNGESSGIVGKIKVPVSSRGKEVYLTMIVLDHDTGYNAILGRPWIVAMGAIVALHMQVLKFKYKGEVHAIRGKQKVARNAYNQTMKASNRSPSK